MTCPGIIALDIDGTITEAFHSVPPPVVEYLRSLAQAGWKLVFITGRTFSWGFSILTSMPFSYLFAVQNGAILLDMPSRTILTKRYLERSIFSCMDKVCETEDSDYVVYAGYEHEDICYYRPSRFSPVLADYLQRRVDALQERYSAVASFDCLPLRDFPSIKCFGPARDAKRIAFNMEQTLGLHVAPVQDPFDSQYMVAQATHPQATKGHALTAIKSLYPDAPLTIAVGNDYNDASMFAVSDIAVVMGNAPADLQLLGDVAAPPVGDMGVIEGLQKALHLAKKF